MKLGILWDLDGTLLDTLDDLTDSVNHALASNGFPRRTREEVRQFVGNGAMRLMQLAVPAGTEQETAAQVFRDFQIHYQANCQHKTAPYPGVLEALQEVGEKYPMAIVSNKPDGAVKRLCSVYFPGVYAQGQTPDCPRKPAPDMVFQAMKTIGAEQCIYIGDSEVDVATAKNARVPCLSVTWGFRDEPTLVQAGAAVLCADPGELLHIINTMAQEMENHNGQ